ncbi:MAG: RNA polymerase sigma factor [Phycisphaeraceae bacterium]
MDQPATPEHAPDHPPATLDPGDAGQDHRQRLHDAVARYHRPLVAYARSRTGDLERARDAAQDTLLRLCQQPPATFERDIAPRLAAWLFTVCRNRLIDLHRKETRMTPAPGIIQDAVASPEPSPSEHADAHDQRHCLLALVADLPTHQREVVQLRFQGGLAYREIAEVTGHSTSYVGVLLHEAIKQLRTRMTKLNA